MQMHPLDVIIANVDKVHNTVNKTVDPQLLAKARIDLAATYRDLANEISAGNIDFQGADLEDTMMIYLRMDMLTKYLQLMRP